jgi:hypothetical protein
MSRDQNKSRVNKIEMPPAVVKNRIKRDYGYKG